MLDLSNIKKTSENENNFFFTNERMVNEKLEHILHCKEKYRNPNITIIRIKFYSKTKIKFNFIDKSIHSNFHERDSASIITYCSLD